MKTSSHGAVDLKRILDSMETMQHKLIRIGMLVLLLSAGGYLAAGKTLGYLQKATGARIVAYGLPDAFIGYITISLELVWLPLCGLSYMKYWLWCPNSFQSFQSACDSDSGWLQWRCFIWAYSSA